MSAAVFVAVLSESCGHCVAFKNTYLSKLQDELAKKKSLQTEYIILSDQASKDEMVKKYPRDLINHLSWFPIFLLIPRNSWDSCRANNLLPLTSVVFNGPPNSMRMPSTNIPPTSDNLVKWVDENLSNNPIFKSSNSTRSSKSSGSRSSSHMKIRRNVIL